MPWRDYYTNHHGIMSSLPLPGHGTKAFESWLARRKSRIRSCVSILTPDISQHCSSMTFFCTPKCCYCLGFRGAVYCILLFEIWNLSLIKKWRMTSPNMSRLQNFNATSADPKKSTTSMQTNTRERCLGRQKMTTTLVLYIKHGNLKASPPLNSLGMPSGQSKINRVHKV